MIFCWSVLHKNRQNANPSMIKYMLDTNIAIYVIKRKPPALLRLFNTHAHQLCLSTISLAELMHGVQKSEFYAKNLHNVEQFSARLEILLYDNQAALHYGDIRTSLERQGKIIGMNDLHIAAHARSAGLILVTNNEREFQRVQGLRVENWLKSVDS